MTASVDHEVGGSHEARQFGTPEPGLPAVERPGSYAIIVDDDRVLVIDDGRQFYLPGGGAEPGETPLETVQREVLEETGHEAAEAVTFHEARQWVVDDETDTAVNRHCTFFLVELGDRPDRLLPLEEHARWAPREAAVDLMAEEASRWALSVALCAQAIVTTLGAGRSPAA